MELSSRVIFGRDIFSGDTDDSLLGWITQRSGVISLELQSGNGLSNFLNLH